MPSCGGVGYPLPALGVLLSGVLLLFLLVQLDYDMVFWLALKVLVVSAMNAVAGPQAGPVSGLV
jgi:hypothetical protein